MQSYELVYEEHRKQKPKKQEYKMSKEQIEAIGIWVCNAILFAALIIGHYMQFK